MSNAAEGAVREPADVTSFALRDDGTFPNNEALPALVYRQAFHFANSDDAPRVIERVFEENGWSNGWRNGVYATHHYHSTAHEVLGCYAGSARVQLGGAAGPLVELERGDVLVIPAGVAHKRVEASSDFRIVGCYAGGADYDMNYGKPDERHRTGASIAKLPLPERDPIYGANGPLVTAWSKTDQ